MLLKFKKSIFKMATMIIFDHFPSLDLFYGFKPSKYIRKILKKAQIMGLHKTSISVYETPS